MWVCPKCDVGMPQMRCGYAPNAEENSKKQIRDIIAEKRPKQYSEHIYLQPLEARPHLLKK